MTENEENKRFEIKDPSESFRELVSDIDAGHDPGDEHRDPPTPKEEVADPPVAADPAPAPVAETSTTQADETAMKETNDYIDEDLASVVKSLVGEISRLKSQASQASQSKKADELVMGLSEEWAPVFKERQTGNVWKLLYPFCGKVTSSQKSLFRMSRRLFKRHSVRSLPMSKKTLNKSR